MSDVLIKFGGHCRTDSVGYTGTNDRVAAALNQMFAPEIAISGLSTTLSGFQNVATFGAPSSAQAGNLSAGEIGR
jgi:hypothetical protein